MGLQSSSCWIVPSSKRICGSRFGLGIICGGMGPTQEPLLVLSKKISLSKKRNFFEHRRLGFRGLKFVYYPQCWRSVNFSTLKDPMLCLRRISLDAKSRLLFLSRSHSSTNDSMPKSTAISRLIHKKFLEQNGNNSPQAIFVFFQQRSLRTRAHALVQPVLEEKDKSDKDKDQKGKSGSPLFTVLNNLGFGVFCACVMYTYGSFKEYYFVSRTNELKFGSGSSDEKLMNIFEKFLCATIRTDFALGLKIGVLLAVWTYRISWTKVPDRALNKDMFSDANQKSDAKDSEFKFGFGPSGRKPKNKFEEDLYGRLHKKFEKKSEEEFEKFLRWFDPEKFVRRVPLYSLAAGVCYALLTYPVFFVMFRKLVFHKLSHVSFLKYCWQGFITLLTFNTADAYFSARVHLRTTYGYKCLGK